VKYYVFMSFWKNNNDNPPTVYDCIGSLNTYQQAVTFSKSKFRTISEDWEETATVVITNDEIKEVSSGIYYKDGSKFKFKLEKLG